MNKKLKQGVNVDQFADVAAYDKFQDGSGGNWSEWARQEWGRHFLGKRGVSLARLLDVALHRDTAPAFTTYTYALAMRLGVDINEAIVARGSAQAGAS